jgi:uncharacterized protein (TIGR03067 family)
MKPIFAIAALLTLALSLEGKPVPKLPEKPPAKPNDKDLLQGDWEMSSYILSGKVMSLQNHLTIKGDQWILRPPGAANPRTQTGITFQMDSSKSPKTLDLTYRGIDGTITSISQGIYKIEGDTFTLSRSAGKGERPTDFTGEAGILVVWKRIAKAK